MAVFNLERLHRQTALVSRIFKCWLNYRNESDEPRRTSSTSFILTYWEEEKEESPDIRRINCINEELYLQLEYVDDTD